MTNVKHKIYPRIRQPHTHIADDGYFGENVLSYNNIQEYIIENTFAPKLWNSTTKPLSEYEPYSQFFFF